MSSLTGMLRMLGFHIRMFAANSYFVQLLFTSTLSILLLQYVASFAVDRAMPNEAWLRAGMMGTWVVCAVSTGLVGFQRFQGTLVYMVTSAVGPLRALLPVITSASVFAMLAFPLAYVGASLINGGDLPAVTLRTVGAAVVFWFASSAMALVLTACFSYSPDAIVYESLTSTPLVLASGIFGLPASLGWAEPALRLIPLRSAVRAFDTHISWATFATECGVSLAVSIAWIIGAYLIARGVVNMAIRDATVEIV